MPGVKLHGGRHVIEGLLEAFGATLLVSLPGQEAAVAEAPSMRLPVEQS